MQGAKFWGDGQPAINALSATFDFLILNSPIAMVIAPSELILNARGAIYHLDLRPEELADTVITVGDPNRVQEISKRFDWMEYKAAHREFVTHTGYVGSKRISVVGTGIGPDNIDIVLNELDALANINLETRAVKENKTSLTIIRLGTSGSLRGDIPVDDLVASSFGIGLDNLMHYYQYEANPEERYILNDLEQHLPAHPGLKPYVTEGAIRLRSHFTHGFHQGITVTCPGFYGPQGRMLRAPLAFPNLNDLLGNFESRQHRITNFEMETSAIYGLGRMLGHQCLSINTIVANRVNKTFSPDGARAVDKMIEHCLPLIETL